MADRPRLKSAESGIDKVIGEGIGKVRSYLSCTRICPRHPRICRTRQNQNSPQLPQHQTLDPLPLAASQLFWAKQWVPHNDPRCSVTILTRANCKSNGHCLQQQKSSAKSPSNPKLVEDPPGINVLKLHQGLKTAESLLAIHLRMVTNGLDAFLFQPRVPPVSSRLCCCSRGQ